MSFGGRTAVGEGFGIPLALRYVLEFASNVKEAVALLKRVPVHMSYSVALLDRAGRHAIVFVTPDRPAEVLRRRVVTNHQHKPEWKRHAATTRSVEREEALQRAIAATGDPETMLGVFMQPPVYQTSYGRGYGTLYTALYRPEDASAELVWPSGRWMQSCASFEEGRAHAGLSGGDGGMKILVLGAGVVGTAAAYWLGRDGHEVTVIERHAEAARGTSYSNAGLVSPGDATAWASPAALKTFLRSLYTPDLGIKVRLRFDPYFYLWSLRFLAQCTTTRLRANTDVKLRLALYSRDCINAIAAETGIDYDQRAKGILYFFRSQQSFDHGTDNYRYLAEHGLPIEIVGRDRLVELEPGLAGAKDRIAGGVYSPIDQTGDSRQFVEKLAAYATEKLGVKFRSARRSRDWRSTATGSRR